MKFIDLPEKIKPFVFHGLDLPEKATKAQVDCPFCDKAKGFGLDYQTGKWRCVRCNKDGNVYSFLQQLYFFSSQKNCDADLAKLAKDRKLDVEELKEWGICKSIITGDWLIPGYNREIKIANLSKLMKTAKGWQTYNTPGCKPHPFGVNLLPKSYKRLYIAEGQWDGIALRKLFKQYRKKGSTYVRTLDPAESLAAEVGILAATGCGNFSADHLPYLTDAEVNVLFDNDHPEKKETGIIIQPGWDGMQRLVKLAYAGDKPPKSMSILHWGEEHEMKEMGGRFNFNPDLASGYDIRDLITDQPALEVFKFLDQRLIKTTKPKKGKKDDAEATENAFKETVEPIERTSFEEVCADWEKSLCFTPVMKDTFACLLATVLSTPFPGDDQIWFRIIGPGGCLAADTEVEISRAKKSFKCSIEHLVKMFNGGWASGKQWNPNIPTYIRSRDKDGFIRLVEVARAIVSGEKKTFTLKTASGHIIRATKDHKFFTPQGWKKLGDLMVGDTVYVRDGVKVGPCEKKKRYLQTQGLKHHPYAGQKEKNIYCVMNHRLAVEAEMNSLTLDKFIDILRTGAKSYSLQFLKSTQIVHHIDGNYRNNRLSNLEVLDSLAEHSKLHGKEGGWQSITESTCESQIVSITAYGKEPTFDLTVTDELHNFMANGITVANSGKTTLVDAIAAHRSRTLISDVFTGFHSGCFSAGKDKDVGLLPRLRDKTFIVKEADTILSSASKDRILSELRGVYDQSTASHYRTGATHVYQNLKVTVVLCGTDSLRLASRSYKGDRFLDCEIMDPDVDTSKFMDKSIDKSYDTLINALSPKEENEHQVAESSKLYLKQVTLGYIMWLIENVHSLPKPKVTEAAKTEVKMLADFVSFMRARVERENAGGDMLYKPRKELSTRLGNQLFRLAFFLALVLQRKEIDAEVLRIVRKIALDTSEGFPLQIVKACYEDPTGVSLTQLEFLTGLSISSVKRVIQDMMAFEIIRKGKAPNKSGISGRDLHLCFLSPSITQLCQQVWRPITRKVKKYVETK